MTRLSDSFPIVPENCVVMVGKNDQLGVYVVVYQPRDLPGMLHAIALDNNEAIFLSEPVENTEEGHEQIAQFVQENANDIPLAWSFGLGEVSA